MSSLYNTLGGRKMTVFYISIVLLFGYALLSDAAFESFATALGALYAFLSGSVAWEDTARLKHGSK